MTRKVHLQHVDGTVYCGVSNGSHYPDDEKILKADKMKDVTCLRCKRKFYRYPINATVRHIFDGTGNK